MKRREGNGVMFQSSNQRALGFSLEPNKKETIQKFHTSKITLEVAISQSRKIDMPNHHVKLKPYDIPFRILPTASKQNARTFQHALTPP